MIEKIKALSLKLKKAFPKGYVHISSESWHYRNGREELVWCLSISEINMREEYKTWEALDHDAHFLLNKQAMGVYNDDLCNADIVSQAEEIKNSTAPWNKF